VNVFEFGDSVLDPELPVTTELELVLMGKDAVSEVGLKGELSVATAFAATQVFPLPLVH
jgi:hypothetical protein